MEKNSFDIKHICSLLILHFRKCLPMKNVKFPSQSFVLSIVEISPVFMVIQKCLSLTNARKVDDAVRYIENIRSRELIRECHVQVMILVCKNCQQ